MPDTTKDYLPRPELMQQQQYGTAQSPALIAFKAAMTLTDDVFRLGSQGLNHSLQ